MTSKNELFLFPEATSHSWEIDEWLSGDPVELYSMARQWFEVFRNCGEDVNELLHDSCPTACLHAAAFGYVNVFKSHINIGFFMGAYLNDPSSLLEGSGKRMRHVKLRVGNNIDSDALARLISEAYSDIGSRLTL